MIRLDSLHSFYWRKSMLFIQYSTLASLMLADWNIDLIIDSHISSSGNVFNTFVSIVVFLYLTWLDFNQLSHIVIADLHTYNNLQLFTSSMGGCELSTKCTTIVSFNDSSGDGKMFKKLYFIFRILCKTSYVSLWCVLTFCASFVGIS